MYKKGARVRHPIKQEWGVGHVLEDGTIEGVKVFFERAGDKDLSLSHTQLILLTRDEGRSLILDALNFDKPTVSKDGKPLCKNCGSPTNFTDRTTQDRVLKGWCEPCYKQSHRTFEDKDTGEIRYLDETRTIDGVKSRYNRK